MSSAIWSFSACCQYMFLIITKSFLSISGVSKILLMSNNKTVGLNSAQSVFSSGNKKPDQQKEGRKNTVRLSLPLSVACWDFRFRRRSRLWPTIFFLVVHWQSLLLNRSRVALVLPQSPSPLFILYVPWIGIRIYMTQASQEKMSLLLSDVWKKMVILLCEQTGSLLRWPHFWMTTSVHVILAGASEFMQCYETTLHERYCSMISSFGDEIVAIPAPRRCSFP